MSEPVGIPAPALGRPMMSSAPVSNGATYGFFTDQSFATYQPGSATAQARGVLTTLVPGVGNVSPGVAGIPIMGLVGVAVILFLFEKLRLQRRR